VIPQQKAGPYTPGSPEDSTRRARKPSSWSQGTDPGGLTCRALAGKAPEFDLTRSSPQSPRGVTGKRPEGSFVCNSISRAMSKVVVFQGRTIPLLRAGGPPTYATPLESPSICA